MTLAPATTPPATEAGATPDLAALLNRDCLCRTLDTPRLAQAREDARRHADRLARVAPRAVAPAQAVAVDEVLAADASVNAYATTGDGNASISSAALLAA